MKLIPKWLSIWGFIGCTFTLIATFLFMLDLIKMFTTIYFIMNIPIAIFELILAIFLIVKGFNCDELSLVNSKVKDYIDL